jgi:hypothetical protein
MTQISLKNALKQPSSQEKGKRGPNWGKKGQKSL